MGILGSFSYMAVCIPLDAAWRRRNRHRDWRVVLDRLVQNTRFPPVKLLVP